MPYNRLEQDCSKHVNLEPNFFVCLGSFHSKDYRVEQLITCAWSLNRLQAIANYFHCVCMRVHVCCAPSFPTVLLQLFNTWQETSFWINLESWGLTILHCKSTIVAFEIYCLYVPFVWELIYEFFWLQIY